MQNDENLKQTTSNEDSLLEPSAIRDYNSCYTQKALTEIKSFNKFFKLLGYKNINDFESTIHNLNIDITFIYSAGTYIIDTLGNVEFENLGFEDVCQLRSVLDSLLKNTKFTYSIDSSSITIQSNN